MEGVFVVVVFVVVEGVIVVVVVVGVAVVADVVVAADGVVIVVDGVAAASHFSHVTGQSASATVLTSGPSVHDLPLFRLACSHVLGAPAFVQPYLAVSGASAQLRS